MTNKKCMVFAVAALIVSGALVGCDKTPKPKAFSDTVAEGVMQKAEAATDSAGQVLDDSAITAKAKWALAGMADFKGMDISVETVRGRVTLSGHVVSQAESQQAATVVSRVEGVKAVDNRLMVQTRG